MGNKNLLDNFPSAGRSKIHQEWSAKYFSFFLDSDTLCPMPNATIAPWWNWTQLAAILGAFMHLIPRHGSSAEFPLLPHLLPLLSHMAGEVCRILPDYEENFCRVVPPCTALYRIFRY